MGSIPTKIVLSLIKLYRYFLSPIVGWSCRFSPTCSCYAMRALAKYGFARGLFLSVQRICRCHPWHPGGTDEIP